MPKAPEDGRAFVVIVPVGPEFYENRHRLNVWIDGVSWTARRSPRRP
jgi:hypothetical protein